jgi:hypothetical protein
VSSFPPEDTLRDMELSGQRSTALATKSGKRLQHLLSSRYSDEPSIPPATKTGDLPFVLDKHWWPGRLEQLQREGLVRLGRGRIVLIDLPPPGRDPHPSSSRKKMLFGDCSH